MQRVPEQLLCRVDALGADVERALNADLARDLASALDQAHAGELLPLTAHRALHPV